MKLTDWIFSKDAGSTLLNNGNGCCTYVRNGCNFDGGGGGFGASFGSWGSGWSVNRSRGEGGSLGQKPEPFVLDNINMEIEYLQQITKEKK